MKKVNNCNIYVMKYHGQWRARVKGTDASGDYHDISHLTGVPCNDTDNTNRQKALDAARAWAASLDIKPQRKEVAVSVYKYCRNHYATRLAMQNIEARTVLAYKTSLKYIDEFFGEKSIAQLSTKDVEAFIQSLQERGLAPNTIKKTFNVLHHCVRHAVAVRDIDWDFCAAIKPPKRVLIAPNPLDEPSRRKLLTMLAALEPTPYVIAVYLAYFTGMRRGEICALTWEDVALKSKPAILRVRHAISTKEGGTYIKGTKTGQERRIPLPDALVDILKARRSEMVEDCMSLGIAFNAGFYVCGNIDGGYMSPTLLTRWWGQHAREWGLTGTQGRTPVLHDLRHTYATIAVRTVDPKTAQDILGHSDINMTMRYADTSIEQLEKARNPLAAALGESKDTGAKVEEFPRKAANF